VDVIVVNAHHPAVRRRFTIAHEIGHWALDKRGLFFNGMHADDELEIEHAMGSPPTLLMPDDLVKAEVQRSMRVPVLAKTFQVSPAAMKRRLSDLDLLLPDPDFDGCFASSFDDLPREYY
jgi:Zn-dependent peptidase ImmA (M78 family)